MKDDIKYSSQKKYLSQRNQRRGWVDSKKYESFKSKVESNGDSIYSVINQFIDQYCQ